MTSQTTTHATQCTQGSRHNAAVTALLLECDPCSDVQDQATLPYNSRALLCHAARCGSGSYAAAHQGSKASAAAWPAVPSAQMVDSMRFAMDVRESPWKAPPTCKQDRNARGPSSQCRIAEQSRSVQRLNKASTAWSAVHQILATVQHARMAKKQCTNGQDCALPRESSAQCKGRC